MGWDDGKERVLRCGGVLACRSLFIDTVKGGGGGGGGGGVLTILSSSVRRHSK